LLSVGQIRASGCLGVVESLLSQGVSIGLGKVRIGQSNLLRPNAEALFEVSVD
jgi:hypothetical protein